ncbi:MAG TPA: S49 family peptidase [Candidatus Tenderia electrophaga]|uniref:S49 family peptidase n=1 Tax=Candidatus Tenderia electrophaga TaxID=1748243 RepID=A0A832N5J6_9GAMM|nr:S49 family peptidase [Candidatus Tenderia electrophaga]
MKDNNTPESKDPWTESPLIDERSMKDENKELWERELIGNLAMGALKEQRRARRWGIFFKFFMVAYLLVFLFALIPGNGAGLTSSKPHTAIIELRGVIADNAEASADNIVTSLRDAFEAEHATGIILRINSPGGSPVQSGYIYDEIKRLRGIYPDKRLYAVITDMCASGGYYIASAADEIYADKASIVGSIGVIMSGFGFVDSMEKLGVERRMLTAGESKGFLDPFSPLKDKDVTHIKSMLGNIHQQFIDVVKAGRGDRLKSDEALFSGLVWTGEQSVELGLTDGLGSASYVAREIIGQEKIVDYTIKPDPLEQFAGKLGIVMAETLARITGVDAGTIR